MWKFYLCTRIENYNGTIYPMSHWDHPHWWLPPHRASSWSNTPNDKLGVIMVLSIQTQVHPQFILYYFQEEPFDWPIAKKFGAWGTPQHRSLYILPSPTPPFTTLYTWKLNHGQTICDKTWGAIGNISGNTLGTWWEHIEKRQKPKCPKHQDWENVVFVIGQSKDAHHKRKKIELWGCLQLINMIQKRN
jgi:hypothetical protein